MTNTEKQLIESVKKALYEESRKYSTAQERNLISIFHQAITEERERVVGEMREYPKKLFELYNGKMPWVIFQGKADEEEKFTLYKLGFEDAMKILASLDKLKAKE